MADDEFAVEVTDAGAAESEPVQASSLKKGSYMMIKGQPCKVDSISTSKPGKHGSAKCHFVAIQIFTNKKLEEISPAHGTLHSPFVERKKYLLCDIEDDGYLQLIDDDGDEKSDLECPTDEVGDRIRKLFEDGVTLNIVVLSACGQEKVIDCEEDKQ